MYKTSYKTSQEQFILERLSCVWLGHVLVLRERHVINVITQQAMG